MKALLNENYNHQLRIFPGQTLFLCSVRWHIFIDMCRPKYCLDENATVSKQSEYKQQRVCSVHMQRTNGNSRHRKAAVLCHKRERILFSGGRIALRPGGRGRRYLNFSCKCHAFSCIYIRKNKCDYSSRLRQPASFPGIIHKTNVTQV